MHKATGGNPTPFSRGSLCSYELRGNRIIARLFGVFTIQNIHLAEVHFLRLSTKDETTPIALLLNGPHHLLPHRRSIRPVYVLQTKNQRLFLKLDGGAHFRLRQAIARNHEPRQQRMAA